MFVWETLDRFESLVPPKWHLILSSQFHDVDSIGAVNKSHTKKHVTAHFIQSSANIRNRSCCQAAIELFRLLDHHTSSRGLYFFLGFARAQIWFLGTGDVSLETKNRQTRTQEQLTPLRNLKHLTVWITFHRLYNFLCPYLGLMHFP